LMLQDKGMLRSHQKVFIEGKPVGEITSGTFSPILKKSIGFARIETNNNNLGYDPESQCSVEVRDRHLKAKIVELPFVRREKA